MGSVYLSTSATNPATLFGGTWERIQDRFLLCAGTTYAAGSTGGEASHKLTVEEMPSHAHAFSAADVGGSVSDASWNYPPYGASSKSGTTSSAGGGQPHNNMPPYLAVYAWRRTA